MFVAKVLGENSTWKQLRRFLGNVFRESQQAPPSADFYSTRVLIPETEVECQLPTRKDCNNAVSGFPL